MLLQAAFKKHTLQFKFDAGTSRGVLKTKDTYFVSLTDAHKPGITGWGECGPLQGLSPDDVPDFAQQLEAICIKISGQNFPSALLDADHEQALQWLNALIPANLPAVRFGFETALLDLLNGGQKVIFKNDFSTSQSSIPINGLVWMGSKEFMQAQIADKLAQGYTCIKMKIGAIHFEDEFELLQSIREVYTPEQITLRVDANGAFAPHEALEKMERLATLGIHSIEQPIKAGQAAAMAELCRRTPLPIALDEELIGITAMDDKQQLLESIRPQYIILKPTLLGGILSCKEWITLAETLGIGWWMTSALEANIGLNAVSQFTATYPVSIPQGLGTGQLYHNNIPSPLVINHGALWYGNQDQWDLGILD